MAETSKGPFKFFAKHIPYVHRSFQPLRMAVLDEKDLTGTFDFGNECEGMCGV